MSRPPPPVLTGWAAVVSALLGVALVSVIAAVGRSYAAEFGTGGGLLAMLGAFLAICLPLCLFNRWQERKAEANGRPPPGW